MDVPADAASADAAPTTLAPPASPVGEPSLSPAPSKSALKKAAKAERLAAQKLERRAREKGAKKEKRRTRAAKRAAGELDSAEEAAEEAERRAKRARTSRPTKFFNARVVVDLAFDEKMTDKEVTSLTSQLGYTYAANRRAQKAFKTILFTGVSGRTRDRLEAMNDAAYKRWANCEWWEEGYEALWREDSGTAEESMIAETKQQGFAESAEGAESSSTAIMPAIDSSKPAGSQTARENVVYLTADTTEELTELLPTETYIIGGIVDHNRYKNLCLDKANQTGVRHARLPIGKYLTGMQSRKVLTVNQVFEILLKWVETRDWEQALYAVIPKRKLPAPAAEKGGKAERLAHLMSEEGGVDVHIEPADNDKNGLEDNSGDSQEGENVSDPAMQLPTVDIVESSIEIDNVRR